MQKVLGLGRLLVLLLGTVVVAVVAVVVTEPRGWTVGVEVSTGPPLLDEAPAPATDPEILFESPDGSIVIRNPRLELEDRTDRFDVVARVQPDRSVEITEEIVQVFTTPRHGIERIIPLRDEAGDHAMRSLVVSTDPGTPGQVELTDWSEPGTVLPFDPSGVRVRIGDPDRTITGTHRYRLTYVLENVVHAPPDGTPVERAALDAFTEWRQPVYGATYTVIGPEDPVAQACYQVIGGYEPGCAVAQLTADGATFEATPPVPAYSAFTVEVGWPVGTFGPAVVDGPERADWPPRIAAVALAVLGVAVVGVAALGRRRLLWSRTRVGVVETFGGIVEPTAADLVPGSPPIDPPLEFVPPMALRPAELLRLRQLDRADPSRILAATVVDLAARGEIELVAAAKDADWVARRRPAEVTPGRPTPPLEHFEGRLLSALFPGDADEVRFGDRAKAMGPSRNRILEQLDDDLTRKGLLRRRLGTRSTGCVSAVVGALVLLAVAVGVLGVGLALVLRQVVAWPAAMVATGAVIGLAVALYGLRKVVRAGSALTTKGMGAVYRAGGFQRFFDESEAMHAQAAADAGLLRQYLGYAVAFDAVGRWVAAFDAPDLSWLGTTDVGTVTGFVYGSTMHRAATPPAPVSSGSGSGSGFGGGFGGGGGGGSGGGGGGSW